MSVDSREARCIVGICKQCGNEVFTDEDFTVNDEFEPVCESCSD